MALTMLYDIIMEEIMTAPNNKMSQIIVCQLECTKELSADWKHVCHWKQVWALAPHSQKKQLTLLYIII